MLSKPPCSITSSHTSPYSPMELNIRRNISHTHALQATLAVFHIHLIFLSVRVFVCLDTNCTLNLSHIKPHHNIGSAFAVSSLHKLRRYNPQCLCVILFILAEEP